MSPDNLEKRGEIWHYRFMKGGRLYRGSTDETGIKAAKDFLRILQTGLRDRTIHPDMRKSPTLEEFSVRFLAHIDKRKESGDLDRDTQRTYHNGWRLLSITPVAGLRLDQIGRPDAAELEFPGSPYNANQALATLSRMLNYATEVGYLRAAPKIGLRRVSGRFVIVEPWLEDLLIEFAPPLLRAFITIMIDSGPRPDEVCRMRWEHVYLGHSTIHIPFGKTKNSERDIGMTQRMRDELRARREEIDRRAKRTPVWGESPWVFPSRVDPMQHSVNPKSAWQDTKAAVIEAARKRNLPAIPAKLVLYSLRDTFATNFLQQSGGDVGKLMMLMGHADIQTTQKYLHPSTAGAAKIMDAHNDRKLQIVRKKA